MIKRAAIAAICVTLISSAPAQATELPASRPDLKATTGLLGRKFPDSAEGRLIKKVVLLRERLINQPPSVNYTRMLRRLSSLAQAFCNRYPGSRFVPEAKISRAIAFLALSRFAAEVKLNYVESAREIVAPIYRRKDLDEHTRVMALFVWSEIMLTKKKAREAIKALEEVVTGYPEHARAPQALMGIAQIRVSRLEYDEALAAYRKLVDNYGESDLAPEALRQMVIVHCTRRDMEKAEAVMKEMLEKFKTSQLTVHALGTLGTTYEKMGEKEKAIARYRQIEKLYEEAAAYYAGKRRFIQLKGTVLTDDEVKLEKIKLSDYRGKVVVLYFWGYWSDKSISQLTRVNWTHKQLHDKGLETIGIYFGRNLKELQNFLYGLDITWPHVLDKNGLFGHLAVNLGVDRVPMTILLDHTGKVREVGLLGPQLHRAAEALVKEIPPKPASRPASAPASRPSSKPATRASAGSASRIDPQKNSTKSQER